jgi:hypothetical protein
MARKNNKQMDMIEQMLRNGYEAKDIYKVTGIPRSTVYQKVTKLKKEARYQFDQVMQEDYLWLYQMNLSNYSRTIKEVNEKMVEVNEKYDELERITKEALSKVDDAKHVSKSNFIANLIQINNSRSNDLARLTAQRDKASEMKAKLFNQGPVVHKVSEFMKLTTNKTDINMLPVVENKPVLNVTSVVDLDITPEDEMILREMEDEF